MHAIEHKCFARLRDLLRRWKAMFEKNPDLRPLTEAAEAGTVPTAATTWNGKEGANDLEEDPDLKAAYKALPKKYKVLENMCLEWAQKKKTALEELFISEEYEETEDSKEGGYEPFYNIWVGEGKGIAGLRAAEMENLLLNHTCYTIITP